MNLSFQTSLAYANFNKLKHLLHLIHDKINNLLGICDIWLIFDALGMFSISAVSSVQCGSLH